MGNCPICKIKAPVAGTIRFVELVGLVAKYEQRICVCDVCQLIFVSNPIGEDVMIKYYKELSKYEGRTASGDIDIGKLKMSERQYNFVMEKVSDIKSVLEIGASTGFNLHTFSKKGFSVYGVEPSERNKMIAREKYGVELYAGSFDQFYSNVNRPTYDLITASHVLEHLHSPADFIQKLRKINSKYVYLEVPSFEAQIADEPYGAFFYEHISYFTVESLTHLMHKHRYGAVRIQIDYNMDGESPRYPVICSLWEKSRKGKPFKSVYSSRILLQEYLAASGNKFKRIKNIITSIKDDAKIAVWGTGSHTSRLLGMTNLGSKNIIKFYDSDPKRHKFLMLGKPITQFDADDVYNGLVDTILISTFSGEKSINQFISEQHIHVDAITLYEN